MLLVLRIASLQFSRLVLTLPKIASLFLTLAAVLIASPSGRATPPRIIANQYTPTPGLPGRQFNSFSRPTINDRGDVSFRAVLSYAPFDPYYPPPRVPASIWTDVGSGPRLMARASVALPNPAGAEFADFSYPELDAAGRVSFSSILPSGGGGVTDTTNETYWTERNGLPTLVVREGDPVPGFPDYVFGKLLGGGWTNRLGQKTFSTVLRLPGGADEGYITPRTTTWFQGANGPELIARWGDPAPGAPAGSIFGLYLGGGYYSPLGPPTIDDTGRVAFAGTWITADWSTEMQSGLWAGKPGALSLITSSLASAPGTAGNFLGIGSPILSDRGSLMFAASLRHSEAAAINDSNDGGLWSTRGGAMHLVVREGAPAPGGPAGAVFDDDLRYFNANRDGRISFRGAMRPGTGGVTSSTDYGVWSDASGALTMIAREGDHAPGTPLGVNFGEYFWSLSLNDRGQVAFVSTLQSGSGGVTSENDVGIWAQDAAGVLQLLAREGDVIEVAPGVTRTILALEAADLDSSHSNWASFNNRGQFAFLATFTNFQSAILVSDTVARPPGASADFDFDGVVDAFDLGVWKNSQRTNPHGDADGDGDSDGSDFLAWQRQLGGTPIHSVPEPQTLTLLLIIVAMRRRRVP